MFILLSAPIENPTNVFPIFRADTVEAIGQLITNESRIVAETNKVEWVPSSQFAKFVHPQDVIDQERYPIQEVIGNTKEEFFANVMAEAEAQWAQIEQIPTALDHYTTVEESGINLAAIGTESAQLVEVTGLSDTEHLMSSPENAKRLEESISQLQNDPTIADRIRGVADAASKEDDCCGACANNETCNPDTAPVNG